MNRRPYEYWSTAELKTLFERLENWTRGALDKGTLLPTSPIQLNRNETILFKEFVRKALSYRVREDAEG